MRMTGIMLSAVLGTALLIGGCITRGNSDITDQTRVEQVKVNVTTKAEVLQMFGTPMNTSSYSSSGSSSAGEQWVYAHVKVTVKWWAYIPLVSTIGRCFANEAESSTTALTINFTPDGVVSQVSKGKNSQN